MIFVQLLRPTLLPKKTGFLFSVILSMIIWRKKSYWTKMGPKIHCAGKACHAMSLTRPVGFEIHAEK
jgi:hypothetical protein